MQNARAEVRKSIAASAIWDSAEDISSHFGIRPPVRPTTGRAASRQVLELEELARWMKHLASFAALHPLSAPVTPVDPQPKTRPKRRKTAQKAAGGAQGRSKSKGQD